MSRQCVAVAASSFKQFTILYIAVYIYIYETQQESVCVCVNYFAFAFVRMREHLCGQTTKINWLPECELWHPLCIIHRYFAKQAKKAKENFHWGYQKRSMSFHCSIGFNWVILLDIRCSILFKYTQMLWNMLLYSHYCAAVIVAIGYCVYLCVNRTFQATYRDNSVSDICLTQATKRSSNCKKPKRVTSMRCRNI